MITNETAQISPVRAWILAARPKTLAASVVPVAVGSALAWWGGEFRPWPAIFAFFFAVFAQIGANFVNDWADFRSGVDKEDRLGPDRMVAQGVLSPKAMLAGTVVVLAVACGFGLGLIPYGGPRLILVGAVCALFAVLYSAGPFPLAYHGLGDVLVVIFFGLVPVAFTFYVQAEKFLPEIWLAGLSVGLATDNILTSNNYRDRNEDRRSRKWTLVALFGERFGRWFYWANGILAGTFFLLTSLSFSKNPVVFVLPILWTAIHFRTWRRLTAIRSGRELNRILAESARNVVALGIFFILQVLLVKLSA